MLRFVNLKYLLRRLLRQPEILCEYNNIIQEQYHKGIIESCDPSHYGTAHYLLHHVVIRKEREATKFRIVYDGSAKLDTNDLSLFRYWTELYS